MKGEKSMQKPLVEFKFKYETLTKEVIERRMMVSLDDVLFIDERFLHLYNDEYDYELAEGEYERLRNILISFPDDHE